MLSYNQFLNELCNRPTSEMFSILTFVTARFIREKELGIEKLTAYSVGMERIFNIKKEPVERQPKPQDKRAQLADGTSEGKEQGRE